MNELAYFLAMLVLWWLTSEPKDISMQEGAEMQDWIEKYGSLENGPENGPEKGAEVVG